MAEVRTKQPLADSPRPSEPGLTATKRKENGSTMDDGSPRRRSALHQALRDEFATRAVSFTPATCNRKLAPVRYEEARERPRPIPIGPFVSSTFASIQTTCPSSCVFKRRDGEKQGCYVDAGFTRIFGAKMDRAGLFATPLDVARAEAKLIDHAFNGKTIPQDGARGGRDLRLHVGGDARTASCAETLGKAAARWRARGGGTVWTYTHAWRAVRRAAWGQAVSVLASVERPDEIAEANRRGYPAAVVVEQFSDGSRTYDLDGHKVVPCPAETTGTTCAECRLCLDRDLLKLGVTIGFSVHGRDSVVAKERLRLKVIR